ncbi:type II toxin-antitoxin system BrnA family antitoxin [Cyclobacterium plantarum]|uniref:type II toxin-antitoxin system BrnA family antitoxin n=1 Tax=Cyclobacterium plantarum TaxID=2716263 RepID=UPI003F717DD1
MKKKSISAAEFDEKFEKEEDLFPYLQTDKISKPRLKARRVSVDFPEWMVQELDRAAQKLGITRQSLIKVFIADKLKETH